MGEGVENFANINSWGRDFSKLKLEVLKNAYF